MQAQNYRLFAQQQLADRAPFFLPPYGYQAAIRADALNIDDAIQFLNDIKAVTEAWIPAGVSVLRAVPMLMVRLAERERAQVF